MEKEEKDLLRKKIEQKIIDIKEDIVDLKELTKPIGPDDAYGRISRMDAINNKSVNEATLRNAEAKLNGLESALSNLDNEDFGICTKCKRPIQSGRILLVPESTRCIQCAPRKM